MPRADELPVSLAYLARRQALELSPIRFDADLQRLLPVLERSIANREAGRGAAVAALQEHSRERATEDGNVVPPIGDKIAAAGQVAADAGSPADAASGRITRRGEAEPARAPVK